MKPSLRLALALMGFAAWDLSGPAAGAAPVAVEDFARTADFRQMQLSPDGKSIAFLRDFAGRTHLCVGELGKSNVARFVLPDAPAFGTRVPREAQNFSWISDKRLLFTTSVWGSTYGVAAVDCDGGRWVGLTGYEADPTGRFLLPATEVIHRFYDDDASILMLDRRATSGEQRLYPNVVKVNSITGGMVTTVKNPGNVLGWDADHEGVVRLGIAPADKATTTMSTLYRETAEEPWRTLALPTKGHDRLRALGFDPIDGKFYVAGLNDNDRWTVLPFDVRAGTLGDPLLNDPEYDIAPAGRTTSVAGVPVARMVFSEARQALVGIWYVTESPRVRWFEKSFASFQVAVDKALPDTVNILVGQSRDDQQLLVFAFSDRDPGSYFLFDRSKRSFNRLGSLAPWIKPAEMASMLAVKYEARDGLLIHGYVTVPLGREPKNLPLVVMPHGGPWVRDVWGFNPYVQLLASRGYAVLQMNYRGSTGYGLGFSRKGRRQIGRAIQDDVEDAAQWAIKTGLADPQRLAIMGGSYGGYSVLFALGKSPGLYRCGVSINGVADWLAIFRAKDSDGEFKFARRFWMEEIGDPEDDDEMLRSISPVNFADKFSAPVLIIQGKEDRTVPPRQAKEMIAALEKARRPVESWFVPGEGHGFRSEKARAEVMRRLLAFLETHLGPGAPPVP